MERTDCANYRISSKLEHTTSQHGLCNTQGTAERMHFCSVAVNDGGLGTLKFTVAHNSPCMSLCSNFWSAIKLGLRLNSHRHKIVFARAYKFTMIPLVGSCSTLVVSCFPMEVRKFAQVPARALVADAISWGMQLLSDLESCVMNLMDSLAL